MNNKYLINLKDKTDLLNDAIDIETFHRHLLVVGDQSSNQTETLIRLIKTLKKKKIPILILSCNGNLGNLQEQDNLPFFCFKMGEKTDKPFCFNPLEIHIGVSLDNCVHSFVKAFRYTLGLKTVPLPVLLEEALHDMYRRRGFYNVTQDVENELRFPDVFELHDDIKMRNYHFQGEMARHLSLLDLHIRSLVLNGHVRHLYNCRRGISFENLIQQDVLLNLGFWADREKKMFFVSSFLGAIMEYIKARGPQKHLRHVILIDDAHVVINHQGENNTGFFESMLHDAKRIGEGFIISTPFISDLSDGILKNSDTLINLGIKSKSDAEKIAAYFGHHETIATTS